MKKHICRVMLLLIVILYLMGHIGKKIPKPGGWEAEVKSGVKSQQESLEEPFDVVAEKQEDLEEVQDKSQEEEKGELRQEGTVINLFARVLEEEMQKQEGLLAGACGTWTLKDFYLPRRGLPSEDSAEDYMEEEITIYYENETIYLNFRGCIYAMESIKPVYPLYVLERQNTTTGAADEVCKGYTCVVRFLADERGVTVYLNEEGEVFFCINDAVADIAIFALDLKEKQEEGKVEPYFSSKIEMLLKRAMLRQKYDDIELYEDGVIISDSSYEMPSMEEGITIHVSDEEVEMEVDGRRLRLIRIEEAISIGFWYYAQEWSCAHDEYAIAYTFQNADSMIQLIESTKGETYVKVWANEKDEGNIYWLPSE